MEVQLYQGDCLDVMNQLIDKGIKVDAVITDPPYDVINKKFNWDSHIDIASMWRRLNLLTNKTSPVILFAQEPYVSKLILSNDNFKYKWYWEKPQATGFPIAKKQPLRCIDEILVFYENQCTYNPQKLEDNTDKFPRNHFVFKVDKQVCYFHPYQKPNELMEYLVKTYTNEGDTVLDFTMGSGSTGVACKKLGRSFIGIELDKKYVEIAKKRIDEIS